MSFPDRPSTAAELSESNYEVWAEEELIRLQMLKGEILRKGGMLRPGFIRQGEPLLFGDGTTLYSILFVSQDFQPAAIIHIGSEPSHSEKYCAQFSITIFVRPDYRNKGIGERSLTYSHEIIQSIISEQEEERPAIICQQIGVPKTGKYKDLRDKIIERHISCGYTLINYDKGQLTKEIYHNSK